MSFKDLFIVSVILPFYGLGVVIVTLIAKG